MRDREKKQLAAALVVGLGVWLWRRGPTGVVSDRDIEQAFTPTSLPAATEAAISRLTIAMLRSRQLMGADPNTRATKNPDAAGRKYIEDTLALARKLNAETKGLVGLPTEEETRYALSKTLPGDDMARVNEELYGILGIVPSDDNVPTKALTPASEQRARQLIAKWRPYSSEAVKLLFYHLDDAKALGGEA